MGGHFSRYQRNSLNRARLVGFGCTAALLVIICAGIGTVLLKIRQPTQVARIEVVKEPAIEMVDVLVASRDIDQNEWLTPALFHRSSIPRSMVRASTIKSFDEIEHQYAKALILANMPVDRGHIRNTTASSPIIEESIPKGFRVVAIRVNEVSSVEGWASPGSYVDVQWLYEKHSEQWLQTIAQRAKILTAERRTELDNAQTQVHSIPQTVTLLVTEQDASTVQLAATRGTLSLSLRNPDDLTPSDLKPRKMKDLTDKPEEGNACPNKLTTCSQDRTSCVELCLDDKGKLLPAK